MKRSYTIALSFLLLWISCTPYKKVVLDEDFIEPIDTIGTEEIEKRISSLRKELVTKYKDPALHRHLAIYYRLQGTPYSRARSIDEIEKAISLDQDDPINYVERGMTFYAMQFTGESQASFKKALELDPGCFHAWHQMARIEKEEYLENMCFTKHLIKALRYYKKAYNLDNTHKDTLFNLGFLHLRRNMYKTARKYASEAIKYYPDTARHHLLMGSVQFRLGEFPRAEKEFNKALELMNDDEISAFLETAPLLHHEKRDDYLTWSEQKKTEWNRKFWLKNDPTMTTELNERLLSHYERVFFARELLTLKRLGIDGTESARGQALISYGLPDKFLYSLGEGLDGPFVVWEYSNDAANFRLYFQDEFLNGNYHIPIDPRFRMLADMTQNRFDNIPQAYEYPVVARLAPLLVQSAQKRGIEGNTSIEFSVAISDSTIHPEKDSFKFAFAVFDHDWTRIAHKTQPIKADTLIKINRASGTYYVYNFHIDMLPRIFECSFGFEFTGGKPLLRGTWKGDFVIRDFGSGSLKTSSIRFVLMDRNGSCTEILDPIPSYSTGKNLCIAYDIYNLKRGKDNISRYRVTYSIKDPVCPDSELAGLRKTLSWMKRGIMGGENASSPYISSSFEQSINASEVSDILQIDIGSLEPKKYLLLLTVEDRNNGETLEENHSFIITE